MHTPSFCYTQSISIISTPRTAELWVRMHQKNVYFIKIWDSPLFPDFVFVLLHRSETSYAFSYLWRVPPPPIGSLRGVCDAACSSAQSHIGIRVERAQRKRQEGAVRVAATADTFRPIITCHITRLNWPEVEWNPPEACSSREVSVACAEAFSPLFFSPPHLKR